MSVEKTGVQCDGCKNFHSCGLVPFKVRVATVKRLGWLIKKAGASWKHYCLDCKTEHQTVKRIAVDKSYKPSETVYWWQRD